MSERTGAMPERRTMLDVARELGRIVSGEQEWDRAFAWAREMRRYLEFVHLCAELAEVPADAAGQIEARRAEVVQLQVMLDASALRSDAIEAAGRRARKMTTRAV